ncbi:MAG: hypothetical protein ABI596_11975 [Pyrinomonadaceae bacterium]
MLLQLTFALLIEMLLLLPALAVLGSPGLLQTLLLPLPDRIIALSRSVPAAGLSLLILTLLFFQPPALLVGLSLIVAAPSALLLGLLLLLLPDALLFLAL